MKGLTDEENEMLNELWENIGIIAAALSMCAAFGFMLWSMDYGTLFSAFINVFF